MTESPPTAARIAANLTTAHRALVTALSAVVDTEADLAQVIARPHLATPCHADAHAACPGSCGCTDCDSPCECACHWVPPDRD